MDKLKRAERLVAITHILTSRPNQLISLSSLAVRFGAAKSTISEDLLAVREGLGFSGQGRLETLAGAAGGARFIPEISREEAITHVKEIAACLSTSERVLAGGFLYMADVLFDPVRLRILGLIFAGAFRDKKPDAVATVETKGIPLAIATAEALGVPVAIIRHGNKVTEGPSVSINYVSGSSRRIQTMSLSRRALEFHRNVLIIDDFMKAGGTARGMIDLLTEFSANVVGIGILTVDTIGREPKLVTGYRSILELSELDSSTGKAVVRPAAWVIDS